MADVWACGQCRSINQPRDQRCYACHTPRTVGGVDPLTLSVTDRAPVVTGPIGTYRSTAGLALLTSLLVLLAVAASVVVTVSNLGQLASARAGTAELDGEEIGTSTMLIIGLALIALLSWAAWLSRVVANLPALDLGYSRVTPAFVFIESLIPGYNIYKVHGIVMDILRRIHPSPRDGVAVLAAWFPLLSSLFISAAYGYLYFRILTRLGADWVVDAGVLVREISVGLQLVAGLFLIALIWRVEGRLRRRAREIRA